MAAAWRRFRRRLGTEVARPDWVREHPRAPWAAVLAVCLGAFMGQLDASIVALAFPRMGSDFGAPLAQVQWVSLAYLGVLAVALVPVGRWSDARGRKLLYVYGFGLFTLASAACGFAPTLGWLVAARAVQGLAAALLQANSVALVVRSVDRSRVRAALSVQAAAQALGLAAGPALGGVLVEGLGWRWVFWVNVPIGAVAIVTGLLLLPRSRDLLERERGDLRGAALLGVSTLLALWVLAQLAEPHPLWVAVGLAAVVAVATMTAFWQVEQRVQAPLVSPARVRESGIGAGLVGALLGYLALFAPLVLYPQVFHAWGAGVGRGGLVLTCLPVGFALTALFGARVGRSMGNATRVRLGALVAAASAVLQCLTWSSPGPVAALLVLSGASLGLVLPANNAMVMTAIPPEASAVTGGMINVARALGTSVGVALAALGVRVGEARGWAGAPLVLGALAVACLLLALTAGSRQPGTAAGCPDGVGA
ncbi:MFS transporter [Phycicoccus sp. 3266]|uniref:MFS transporter n=1 Tax=Phycicoccus sp. 3266 TaxID=2817751 RepID=UPI0028640D93|nr:MFS transporter [Phycicoccus sp. 3266]MDR6864708.1 MFS family permease [Phycicoccus sp. 3266]